MIIHFFFFLNNLLWTSFHSRFLVKYPRINVNYKNIFFLIKNIPCPSIWNSSLFVSLPVYACLSLHFLFLFPFFIVITNLFYTSFHFIFSLYSSILSTIYWFLSYVLESISLIFFSMIPIVSFYDLPHLTSVFQSAYQKLLIQWRR